VSSFWREDMADYEMSGQDYRDLIDVINHYVESAGIADAEKERFESMMLKFDEIQGQALLGRPLLINVEPFTLR
jgi:hypothetical protein